MKWSSFGGSSSLSRWALLLAFLLFWSPLTARGQSSIPTSQVSEPLWKTLLQSTTDLPTSFQNFRDSLTSQIASLQSTMLSLQSSSSQLQQDNASLQESLQASQVQVETSQKLLTQSQTDLSDSIAHTTQAQLSAKALEAQVSVLRIGAWTFGITAGIGAGYFVGHVILKWW